jgi:signal peptidase I
MPRGTIRRSGRSELWWWALLIGGLLVTRASFADQYTVPSESMLPTVRVGDRVLVVKSAYGLRVPLTTQYLVHFEQPARGDVVVLDAPDENLVLLKRVVAVPGDRVHVREGRLEINGQAVAIDASAEGLIEHLGDHGHAVSLEHGGGPDFDATIPAEHYLVMGDNRGNSRDGRTFGLVRRDTILGRARAVFLRDGTPAWRPL